VLLRRSGGVGRQGTKNLNLPAIQDLPVTGFRYASLTGRT
jgi:hypothetical protein